MLYLIWGREGETWALVGEAEDAEGARTVVDMVRDGLDAVEIRDENNNVLEYEEL